MKNTLPDLYDHLFDTLDALRNEKTPMPLDRAKMIADVAQKVINAAAVEVKFLDATGARKGTGFIPDDGAERLPALPNVNVKAIK